MAAIALVAGDSGSVLHVTIKNKGDGLPVDGTGATVVLRYTIDGSSVTTRPMVVVDENPLTVEYQFLSVDLPAPPAVDPDQLITMRAEVEVTDNVGRVTTQLVPFNFKIRAKV